MSQIVYQIVYCAKNSDNKKVRYKMDYYILHSVILAAILLLHKT